jgi:hypothetical protein
MLGKQGNFASSFGGPLELCTTTGVAESRAFIAKVFWESCSARRGRDRATYSSASQGIRWEYGMLSAMNWVKVRHC